MAVGSLSLALLLLSGCKDPGFLDTYPVKGSITFNGHPMAGARVTLHPVTQDEKQKKAMPRGTVEEDGTFTIHTYKIGDGAPAGDYKVTAIWPNAPREMSREPGYIADQLNGRFASADRSELQISIEAGYNEIPEITLR